MKGKMSLVEISKKPEMPRSIGEWIEQIRKDWENPPEFKVDSQKLKHLVIICDGNRRAAQAKGFHNFLGHQAGLETVKGLARTARKWGIKTLTFWLWSTENWERNKKQVNFIMNLAQKSLNEEKLLKELCDEQVKFTHLGRKDRLPSAVRKGLELWEEKTAHFQKYQLNFAIDYGGKDELIRAIIKIVQAVEAKNLSTQEIIKNPNLIWQFLDTKNQTLPDLIIRTGTQKEEIPHTSGFMPLQSEYSGWLFVEDLFPDFKPQAFLNSIEKFQKYERRFGR